MYLKPQIADRLIAALVALSKEVECEVEQRKHSGNDEAWQELDSLHASACQAVLDAKSGHGELSALQRQLLESYDEGFEGLADRAPRDLVAHDDGLAHFLLSEVSDCDASDPDSVAEARARLLRCAEQVQRCAVELTPDRAEATA